MPLGHDGPHEAAHATLAGTVIEIVWTDEYKELAKLPWLVDLTPDRDDPMIAVYTHSTLADGLAHLDWVKSLVH
jgi:hypothetical protein